MQTRSAILYYPPPPISPPTPPPPPPPPPIRLPFSNFSTLVKLVVTKGHSPVTNTYLQAFLQSRSASPFKYVFLLPWIGGQTHRYVHKFIVVEPVLITTCHIKTTTSLLAAKVLLLIHNQGPSGQTRDCGCMATPAQTQTAVPKYPLFSLWKPTRAWRRNIPRLRGQYFVGLLSQKSSP